MVTVKGTETKSTHLSASIVKGGILSKWSGDKSGGVQDHIPFKGIFDGFSSVHFWHRADSPIVLKVLSELSADNANSVLCESMGSWSSSCNHPLNCGFFIH